MKHRRFLPHKINQQGHAHFIIPLVAVLLVALIGGKVYMDLSHAATATATKTWSTASAWSTGTRSNTSIVGNTVALASAGNTATSPTGTSPNDTIVLNGSGGSIVDKSGNKFTVTGGVVYENGKKAGYTVKVAKIAYVNNVIYMEITAGRWYEYTGKGLGWVRHTTDPVTTPVSYDTTGTITLSVNAGSSATWNSLSDKTTTPTDTAVTTTVRTSTNGTTWSAWTAMAQAASSQYLQIQVVLNTTNTAITPTLTSLTLDYTLSGKATTGGGSSTSGSGTTTTGSGTGSSGTTSSSSGCTSGGEVAPCVGSATTGAGGWGTPIFDDEFNGTSLNTNNWSTGWFGSGITGPVNSAEDDCYNPDLVSVSGGYLNEQIVQQSCTGRLGSEPYSAGYITSMASGGSSDLFGFTYGFIEARMYFPAASNGKVANWPAFWLQSLHDGSQTAPNTEIDIEEGLQSSLRWHVLGAGGATACTAGDTGPGWHTIGLDWEPGSAKFYYDGVQVGSTCTSDALDAANTGEMRIVLGEQTSADASLNVSQAAPQTLMTDYVRVWPTSSTVYTYPDAGK